MGFLWEIRTNITDGVVKIMKSVGIMLTHILQDFLLLVSFQPNLLDHDLLLAKRRAVIH